MSGSTPGSFGPILRDTLVYGLGGLVVRLFGFFTLPIYTRLFEPSEYGVISLVSAAMGVASILLGFGVLSGVQRHFFDHEDSQSRVRIVSSGFWFLLSWVVLITIPAALASRGLSHLTLGSTEYTDLFAVGLASAAITALFSYLQNVLRITFHPIQFSVVGFLSASLSVAASLILVLRFGLGLLGFFLGTLIGSSAATVVCLVMVSGSIRFTFSAVSLRAVLVFAAPLVPAGLAYWILDLSNRLLLGRLGSLDQVGLYAIAGSLIAVMEFVRGAFGQAWSPRAYQIFTSDTRYPRIFGKTLLYVLLLFSFMAVGVSVFAREGLLVLTTPKYSGAAAAAGPLALGAVAYASTQLTALGISLERKTRYIAYYAWVAAGVNVGLNLLLIPKWGMMGAAVATAFSYSVLTIAYYASGQRLHRLQFEPAKLLKVGGAAVLYVSLAHFLDLLGVAAALPLKVFYCLSYFPFLRLLGVFEDYEIRYVTATLHRLRGLPGRCLKR